MGEIKRRTKVADFFFKKQTHAVYKATTIESVYLQFRKISELIAMSSLVANKKSFAAVYENFSKLWNAEYLLKDIERINPNFYPEPIIQVKSVREGVQMEWQKPTTDYLTKDDLIKLYQKCGAILHAQNPYGSGLDYGYYEKMIVVWRNKIRNLLNAHLVHLLNDDNVYLIQMGTDDKNPTYTPFAPIKHNS